MLNVEDVPRELRKPEAAGKVGVLDRSFWAGRRVLLTGHTGFKGAWLALWLQRLGAEVHGLALPPDSTGAFATLGPWPDLCSHHIDLRTSHAVEEVVIEVDPQVVFHLGAQALVRLGHADPAGTYATNVLGTVHLLEALTNAPSLRAVVVVTSDKVYANAGDGRPFREGDPLEGRDPYSGSKVCAELVVKSWRNALPPSSLIAVATARAGNVIGGGDVSVDRLIPDAWRAISSRCPLRLRYPEATRPWQFVLEPLLGYLQLGQKLAATPACAPCAVNFGPGPEGSCSVLEMAERLFNLWGAGGWTLETLAQPAEASLLALDASLARRSLKWWGRLDLDRALEWTIAWWGCQSRGDDLRELASTQIKTYEELISSP